MKILVTGAAGFIGSRTTEFLLEAGHQVVGVDNLNDYYDVGLKKHRLDRIRAGRGDGFSFVELDIEEKPEVLRLFRGHGFEAVVNLAARAGVRYSMEHPDVYFTTNTLGTLHLLDGMKEVGSRKFVLASTSSLYAGQPMPFREDLPVNTPISPYAASKKAAEAISYTYHHLYGIDVSVCRYFTVYGPAGRPDMSPFRFIKWIAEGTPLRIYGDGTQARDFTYVDDIARGTVAALRPLGFETINLGGGENPVTLKALIAIIENHLDRKALLEYLPNHKADVKETWADIGKADRLLGWKPEVPLEDGVARSVAWYNRNQALVRAIAV
ncbi:MAG: NAD-dependent epimerase/dehydratase family protein [Puniceicoccaceae bacterium]